MQKWNSFKTWFDNHPAGTLVKLRLDANVSVSFDGLGDTKRTPTGHVGIVIGFIDRDMWGPVAAVFINDVVGFFREPMIHLEKV